MRIIPARAGFTGSRRQSWGYVQDHPRSRGVYRLVRDAEAVAGGSSPLARGLREAAANALKRARIIPARAGFTRDCGGVWLGSADHPRSRGVYPNARIKILPALGSSPLARGLLYKQFRSLDALRIIPARAGFTSEYRTSYSRKPDHPRSRGVYIQVAVQLAVDWGSSPLARGLPHRLRRRVPGLGIIPARAGFTRRRRPPQQSARDHPRSRGVYSVKGIAAKPINGSSPLARGLLTMVKDTGGPMGIIPARAGFTAGTAKRARTGRDHPRSRGVYNPEPGKPAIAAGSSPLARGLQGSVLPARGGRRIIPARAGFTCRPPWGTC